MITPNTIFRKTELGNVEIATRKTGLRAELRRILILIDGKNTVAKLVLTVRALELDSLLNELRSLGMIEDSIAAPAISPLAAVTHAGEPTAPSLNPPTVMGDGPPPTREQFLTARSSAVRYLNDNLGPSAEVFAIRIERARDPHELREAVTHVRLSLERMMGEAAGQRFLTAVRSSVK